MDWLNMKKDTFAPSFLHESKNNIRERKKLPTKIRVRINIDSLKIKQNK